MCTQKMTFIFGKKKTLQLIYFAPSLFAILITHWPGRAKSRNLQKTLRIRPMCARSAIGPARVSRDDDDGRTESRAAQRAISLFARGPFF